VTMSVYMALCVLLLLMTSTVNAKNGCAGCNPGATQPCNQGTYWNAGCNCCVFIDDMGYAIELSTEYQKARDQQRTDSLLMANENADFKLDLLKSRVVNKVQEKEKNKNQIHKREKFGFSAIHGSGEKQGNNCNVTFSISVLPQNPTPVCSACVNAVIQANADQDLTIEFVDNSIDFICSQYYVIPVSQCSSTNLPNEADVIYYSLPYCNAVQLCSYYQFC